MGEASCSLIHLIFQLKMEESKPKPVKNYQNTGTINLSLSRPKNQRVPTNPSHTNPINFDWLH
jgi:hypothetical protein